MVKFVAWAFAILNALPILWMLWSSLMGNSELMQGRVFPSPYRSDVSFFEPVNGRGLVVGTLHGQVYFFPSGGLENAPRKSIDLSAVSVSYTVRKSRYLYALSPDEGLLRVNLETQKVDAQWDWPVFEKSFTGTEFTDFLFVSNQIPQSEFRRLADILNTAPLLSNGNSGTLADSLHAMFPGDSSIIDALNYILRSPRDLSHILQIWSQEKNWVNPLIPDLFAYKVRTERQNRELFRWCLAERFPHELTRFRQVRWRTPWVDRIPASDHGMSIASVGKYLCIGVWWNAFPGIAIFDPSHPENIRWVTVHQGLPTSSIQDIHAVSENEVLVAHDQGFSLVDISSGKVKANYMFGERGLPFYFGRDLRIAMVNHSSMLFSYGSEVVFFDFRAGRAIKRLFGGNLLTSDITALYVHGNSVYLGSSEGIVRISLWDLLNEQNSSRDKIENFMRNSKLPEHLENGVVSTLCAKNGKLWIGGLSGKLAAVPLYGKSKQEAVNLPSGGVYLHWRNYEDLWKLVPFKTFFLNSLIICISAMLIVIILGSLAGYALARFRFFGHGMMNFGLLGTQVIPALLFLIPVFLLFSYLQQTMGIHLLNTKIGVIIVYSALFMPMAIWILRGFFLAVPKELEEAALIDGCSPAGAFFRVVLPSALPGIIATAIYVFILAWDELMFVWVLSMDVSSATIPVGMRLYAGQFGNRFDLLMAASTVATVPVLILFLVMQRQMLFGISGSTRHREISK